MFSKRIIYYIRYFILKTGNFSFLNKVYLLSYRISLIFIVQELKRLRTIKAVCLEGSLIQDKNRLKAGSTDIDLIIITEELPFKDELEFIYAYIKKCVNLKRLFPFLKDYSALNRSTLQIHSYAKLLGPYHFKKYDHLYKIVSGNIPCGDHLERLKLTLEAYPIDDFFVLARATLRQINESVYNAATENSIYIRNTIINIERMIEYINKNMPHSGSQVLINDLKKKVEFFTSKGFFVYSADLEYFIGFVNESYKLLEECLNHLITNTQLLTTPIDKKISLTKYNLPDKNLACVAKKVNELITSVYKNKTEALHNMSILLDYNCSYRYIPYIIFNNTIEPETINNLYARLKEINISLPQFAYFSKPVILTKKIFYLNRKYIEAYHGPLDILLFNRLINNVAGENLKTNLKEETTLNFLNTKLYGNISKVDYNYLIEAHNTFEQLMEYLHKNDLTAVIQTIDYMLGNLASHRLAVEKGIITCTSLETFTEYMNHFEREELTGWYESFYRRFYDAKIPLSLQFIKSQIKDLFYFYRKNRDITNSIVSSNLKDSFALHPIRIPHHDKPI